MRLRCPRIHKRREARPREWPRSLAETDSNSVEHGMRIIRNVVARVDDGRPNMAAPVPIAIARCGSFV
jgi:hypothetical protein